MLDIATTFTRANDDCWALVLVRVIGPWDWRNVRLIRIDSRGIPVPRQKSATGKVRLWLGWNGERLAVSWDSQWLTEVATDLAQEVVAWLKENVPKRTD